MKRFDLFGSCSMTVEEVKDLFEARLGQELSEHDSAFRRGVYYRLASEHEEILVQVNSPDDEGYLPEQDFAHWTTLIYVNGSERWDPLTRALVEIGLDMLRTEEI